MFKVYVGKQASWRGIHTGVALSNVSSKDVAECSWWREDSWPSLWTNSTRCVRISTETTWYSISYGTVEKRNIGELVNISRRGC